MARWALAEAAIVGLDPARHAITYGIGRHEASRGTERSQPLMCWCALGNPGFKERKVRQPPALPCPAPPLTWLRTGQTDDRRCNRGSGYGLIEGSDTMVHVARFWRFTDSVDAMRIARLHRPRLRLELGSRTADGGVDWAQLSARGVTIGSFRIPLAFEDPEGGRPPPEGWHQIRATLRTESLQQTFVSTTEFVVARQVPSLPMSLARSHGPPARKARSGSSKRPRGSGSRSTSASTLAREVDAPRAETATGAPCA